MEDRRLLVGEFTDTGAGLTAVDLSSVAWGDYDDDGDLDALVTGRTSSSRISNVYQNTSGTFSDISAGLPGVYSGTVAWGDYDNDNDLDILISGYASFGRFARVYQNTSGSFSDIGAGLASVHRGSVAWGDYDNDGDLDILLTGLNLSSNSDSIVYRNTNGTFSDISAGLIGVNYGSAVWGDYDTDGDLDILLTGREGLNTGTTRIARVYQNTSGAFSDIGAGLTAADVGSAAWGDYDNDGDLDILLTGSTGGSISLIYQNTSGSFSNISAGLTNVRQSSAAWGDYDNDGDLDVLLTGFDNAFGRTAVFRNTNGSFSNISAGLTEVFRGSAAWGDYDVDGDLDILLTGFDNSNVRQAKVFRNVSATANSVPAAPAGLSVIVNSATSVTFSWDAPTDNAPTPSGTATPTAGLNYNLRVGTTPGSSDVVGTMSFLNPPSSQPDGLRKIAQRGLIQGASWTLENLAPDQTYYWSVQAIDTALAGGAFATEQSFVTQFSDKVGVRRTNQFLQDVNGSGQWEAAADRIQIFGNATDTPLAGDWNGDGRDEIGVHRGRMFFLDTNGNGVWDGSAGGDQLFAFGIVGDTPIAGDWDADGTDEIGVQRGNAFFLDASGDGVWGGLAGGDQFFTFGNAGDAPLSGDWDGNGADQLGVHRSNQFFLDLSGNGSWGNGDVTHTFGNSTDAPLAGDWDADGIDNIGVYRSGGFYLDRNGNGAWNSTPTDTVSQFGNASGDVPLVGRWRPLSALMAAGGAASTSSDASALTSAALEPIRQQALVLWANTGLNTAQRQFLSAVQFQITDLPDAQLGLSLGGTILLDADAAGYGWFVDPTPADNSEFSSAKLLIPNPQFLDLLSAVLHELGHELGYDHDDDIEAMMGTLAIDVRRLPS